jgi:hypothetical protein
LALTLYPKAQDDYVLVHIRSNFNISENG